MKAWHGMGALALLVGCVRHPFPVQFKPTAGQLATARKAGIEAPELGRLLNTPLARMTPAEVERYQRYLDVAEPALRGLVDLAPWLPKIAPDAAQLASARALGLSEIELSMLLGKPLFRMQPAEVGRYLGWLQRHEPRLSARIAHLARKNLGQPYELHLLGEFPYETHDAQPLFSLDHGDCVVFAEHVYAMAQSRSWEEFFWMLQRLRDKHGVIGVTTRNHYTEADWNLNNRWLLTDVTARLGSPQVLTYAQVINRTRFFKTRYHIDRAFPIQEFRDQYIPAEHVAAVLPGLREGDFVNIISGLDGAAWASHVGLVVLGGDGEPHLIHSSEPQVREERFDVFMARVRARDEAYRAAGKPRAGLLGFKFLRLNDDPVPPPMAPQPRPVPVTLNPADLPLGPESSNH